MRVIGLTGGVGCGKSTVAEILRKDYNAKILFTDDIAKASYEKGKLGYQKIVETFGEEVLDHTKEIDRNKLAKIVFSDDSRLQQLNSLIHPIVWDEVVQSIEESRCMNVPFLVVESAILVEAGYKKICDEIWYVKSDKEVRIKRLEDTRGYSKEKSESIINNQGSEEEYIRNSDVVLDNNADITKLKSAIDEIINSGKE